MEEFSGWASSVHMWEGQEAVHQPDGVRGGGERWSQLWCLSIHHRCLGGDTSFQLVVTAASPLFPWSFLVLSSTSHPVEEHESMRRLALRTPIMRTAPPWSPGLQNGSSKSLEKELKAELWLHRVRPLCNSTEHGSTAKFQATWSSLQIS